MHTFYESLRYAFLTKFDKHIRDMTAVIMLKNSQVQFPYDLTKR